MLITNEGIPLQTTVDSDTTVQVRDDSLWSSLLLWSSHSILSPQYGGLVSQLSNKTRTVIKEMDKKNDLTCIRVQSTKFEVNFPSLKYIWNLNSMFQLLIAPDDTYILIVQQKKEKDEESKAESQEE